jgi:hypothetical protein
MMASCSSTQGIQLPGGFGNIKLPTSTAELSKEEIGGGLKEALNTGVSKGVDFLNAKDGYYKSAYKILLPAEAQNVANKLRSIPGFSNVEEDILEKINRGAEDAAAKAKPIFVKAITDMSFQDAFQILMGSDDAATQYLQRTTFENLYKEFNPVIVESLDKFNARTYWSGAVNTYNKIPFNNTKANPSLDDYVTREALKGVFSMVAKEELNIRKNPVARVTDLLKKVFSRQDKK